MIANNRFNATIKKGKNIFQNLESLVCDRERVYADELKKEPLLDEQCENSMSYEERMSIKNFEIPIEPIRLEHAFMEEFRERIKATNWKSYSPINPSIGDAAKLAYEFMLYRKTYEKKNGDISESKILQDECSQLWHEIKTGDYSRYIIKTEKDLPLPLQLAKQAIESNPNLPVSLRNKYWDCIKQRLEKCK